MRDEELYDVGAGVREAVEEGEKQVRDEQARVWQKVAHRKRETALEEARLEGETRGRQKVEIRLRQEEQERAESQKRQRDANEVRVDGGSLVRFCSFQKGAVERFDGRYVALEKERRQIDEWERRCRQENTMIEDGMMEICSPQ